MGEESCFRCGEYICRFKNSLKMKFKFRIKRDGSQVILNEIYRFHNFNKSIYRLVKDKTDEYIFSPYADWAI